MRRLIPTTTEEKKNKTINQCTSGVPLADTVHSIGDPYKLKVYSLSALSDRQPFFRSEAKVCTFLKPTLNI